MDTLQIRMDPKTGGPPEGDSSRWMVFGIPANLHFFGTGPPDSSETQRERPEASAGLGVLGSQGPTFPLPSCIRFATRLGLQKHVHYS